MIISKSCENIVYCKLKKKKKINNLIQCKNIYSESDSKYLAMAKRHVTYFYDERMNQICAWL